VVCTFGLWKMGLVGSRSPNVDHFGTAMLNPSCGMIWYRQPQSTADLIPSSTRITCRWFDTITHKGAIGLRRLAL
jgi:hypothetical protein